MIGAMLPSILKWRVAAMPWQHGALRCYSAYRQPVSDADVQLLADYATYRPRPLTLSTLLSFGRPLTTESVLRFFSYAVSELPKRLATRIRSLEALPYIVGTNPHVAKTLGAYRDSFHWLVSYPEVRTLEENAVFAAQLEGLVQKHGNDIPIMAKGFQECTTYMTPTQMSDFLDGAIRNRISVRLIAEQHIALSHAVRTPLPNRSTMRVGVVDMACSPTRMIGMCGSFVSELCEATLGASPRIVIDGCPESTFTYIPVHLEYILTEILKNAFRATVETHYKLYGSSSTHPLPPVQVTISPASVPDHSHRTFLSLRIRDQGGGVSPANMERIFAYTFTTAGRNATEEGGGSSRTGGGDGNLFGEITGKGLQTGLGTIAGLGFGLPMSRLYARYFGGSLSLVSLDGWGSDVFVKLRCLDEAGGAEIG